MNSFLRHLPIFILLICLSNLHAQNEQDWLTVGEKNPNFNETKAAFFKGNAEKIKQYHQDMADLASGKITEIPKGKYTNLKQFMRLLDWYEPRVAESNGDLRVMGEATDRALFHAIEAKKNGQTRGNARWKLLGPINQSASLSGNGRINSIRVDPTNPDVLYACTPASQLFKSDNGGDSWRSISDGIPTAGVTDMAIDSTAPNTLYAVTGDADRALFHPASTGLYKSMDGGETWTQTSLAYTQQTGTVLTTVVLNPQDPKIVLVAGTNGIFRSTDGGTSFVRTSTQSTRELVFKPHNPNVLFAGSKTGGILLRSNDSGLSWERLTNGLPTTDVVRYSIAISSLNPNYVFVLATNATNGMRGFYRSTDGGTNFTVMSTAPNITGTQGWYDLTIAADPTNTDIVYAGGVNTYKSTNGGATWVTTGSGIVHVDIHCMTFSGNTLFLSSDGGVYKTTNQGTVWSNISSDLAIAQLYSLGQSATDENLILSGHQDNGTNLTTNNIGWRSVSGGDGLISFIDRTNDSIMYCTYQNGALRRSLNKGASFSTIYTVPGGYWQTPYIQDPQIPTTLYTGGRQVLKSTNRGTTWDSISNFSGASFRWIEINRSDNKIIYALASDKLYKTVDGGLNWATISSGLPTTGLLHVHIDVNNPQKIYVSASSYTGASLFLSENGGTSWVNYAAGLPRVPTITVVSQMGAPGELYCGTDIGAYYRDSTSASWQAFQTGMPNVPVRDLEIFYPTGKLRAATFGRSIWESPLVNFTKKCEAISPPSVFDVSVNTASISWASALGANRYDVEYKKADSSNWISLKNINNTTVNLTGLSSGSVYEVRVKSVCTDVAQAPFSVVKSFTPTCTAPPPPSVSNVKTTEADVVWSLISGVSNYKLEYKMTDSAKWTTVKGILDFGYTLTGLNKGTNYTVRLSNTCTTADSSLPSLQKDFTTLCPSPQMTVSKIKATEALISWRPISGIENYKLEYKLAENTIWKSVSELKDTFYTLKDLVIGTTYDVRILTYCTSAISPPSLSERFLTSTTPVSTIFSAEKLELTLFPNPAHSSVNLDLLVPKYGEYEVGFYTILGTKILNQKMGLREGRHKINVSTEGFTKGVYYVQVVLGDARVVKKLLIY
jgi:photosystem II stability/assembly factor-like uncharacterized protein